MTHFVAPTDVTKEQKDNNNSAAGKVGKMRMKVSSRLHTITQLLLVQYLVCVTFMINITQCDLLCKFAFY